jgi:hypothetical protein
MADKKDFYRVEKDGHILGDDTLEYCREIYRESADRVNEMWKANTENLDFYDGKDPKLEKRALDKRVKRSAIFVPQLTPAIDARVGDVIASVEERDPPITFRVNQEAMKGMEDAARSKIAEIIPKMELRLDYQLRQSGYFTTVLAEHMLGAEIYKTPSVVKVGWDESTEMEPRLIGRSEPDEDYTLTSDNVPNLRVRFEPRKADMPFCEWLQPHEFLYEPGVSMFERDSRYAGHRKWMTRWEIMSSAKRFGYDMKKVKQFFEDDKAGNSDEYKDGQSNRSAADQDQDRPHEDWKREDKYLLVEWYIVDYDNLGNEKVQKVVVLGDKEVIYDKPSPFKGFKFPFVLLVVNQRLGSVENTPTIERGKSLQVVYNEMYNSFLDGISFRIFPMFLRDKACQVFGEPVYEPAGIMTVSDMDGIRPLVEHAAQLPDLPVYMEAMAMRIRDVTNSQDTQQGIASAQYEKATKTKMRAMGSARRAMPTRKRIGMAICEVAKKFIALNQQEASDAPMWVLPIEPDIPSLTAISDLEQEKQDALLLYSSMRQDPMFQSPAGMKKRRNAWQYVVEKVKRINVGDFVPTQEEIDKDIQDQINQQKAMIDKQAAQEQLAIDAQNVPQGVG